MVGGSPVVTSLSRLSGGEAKRAIAPTGSISLSRLSGGEAMALSDERKAISLSRLSGGEVRKSRHCPRG